MITMSELAGMLLDAHIAPYVELNKASNGRFLQFLESKEGEDVLSGIAQRVNASVGIMVSKEELKGPLNK